jgi:hypothetical protein
MTRLLLSEALLFASPFLLFAAYLALRRRNPFQMAAWEGSISWLAIAGLVAAVVGFVALGALSARNQGAYVPAHMEDGRLVPGQFR